jgi:hypothetical protein
MYEGLPEGTRPQLDAHLRVCDDCRDIYESEKNMHSVLAEDTSGWDVPSDLLVESRRGLADELDRLDNKRSWWRIPAFSVVFTPMRMLESAALIAMGLALGVYVTNQQPAPTSVATNPASESYISVIPRNSTVSNLQVVNLDPATGQVELAGEVSQPLRFQGRTDDPMVVQLIVGALRDTNNPGSRLKAVEVLAQKPGDESIEEVLINALLYDDDAGVRQKAAESLKPYASEPHVLQAFMQTLGKDVNPAIRIAAIEALTTSNPNDRELAKTIHEVTKQDTNPYIRQQALQFVGTAQ